MARPPTVTDEEVLAAALAVLLEKGPRATAADVAARLGVGVATIFRRFPKLDDLFRAALTLRTPDWVDDLPTRAQAPDVRQALRGLALEVVRYYRKILPVLSMVMTNPELQPTSGGRPKTERALRALVAYFAHELEAGRVRLGPPEFAARLFVGALSSHALFELDGSTPKAEADDAFIDPLVALFVGTAPAGSSRRRS